MARPADRAVEAAQIGTWEWRLRTQRVEWSPETDAIFGLRTGSFDGTFEGFLSRVHHADRPQLETAIQAAMADRQPYLMEHRIILPEGTIRWVSCRGRAITDESGDLCGMAGTVEDITGRKETELALRDLQQTLEQRVRERTAELEQTVRDLEQEMARRQQTDAALKASEQRYHALYEHNPTMYFTLTPDGTVLSVNQFGAEELGYRSEELVGRSVLTVFRPEDHQTVLGQLSLCSRSPERTFAWEIQKVRKNGQRLWVKERARAITGPDGSPIILIVCEDITEQRQTQELIRDRDQQLQTTTQFLHTLVRESPLPIVSLDADARVSSWNQAATTLFGWTEEEVLGRELPYVPSSQESEADALWEQGVHNMVRGPISLHRQRKDGALLNLLLWPVFIHDGAGRLTAAIGLYVDQSELEWAEEALRKSEERFDRAVRSSHVGLWDGWRAPGIPWHDPRTPVWWSPCVRDMLGFDPHEFPDVLGSWIDALHPEDKDRIFTALTAHIERRTPYDVEYRLRTKQGRYRWMRARGQAIWDADGSPLRMAGSLQDITDRKQTELALRKSEQAIRQLQEATSAQGLTLDQRIESVLALGCRRFHLPIGLMTKTEGDQLVVTHAWDPDKRFAPGLQLPLCDSYCGTTLTAPNPVAIDHAGASEWRTHPGYRAVGMESYLGTTLVGAHTVYGTICFLSPHPRPISFTQAEKDFLLLMARWVSGELDRSLSEQTLRFSEERWQRFVANAPVGLVMVDADKHILSANAAFCHLTGYSAEEVIGNTYALYTHPDDLPKNLQLTEEFFAGKRQEYTFEKRYVRKNGEIIWVSIRASRLTVHGSAAPLLLAVVEDITDHKQALADRERISQDLHDNILQSLYAVGMQLEAGKLLAGKAPRKSKQHVTQAVRQLNHLVLEVRQFITGLTRRTAPTLDFSVALNQLVASCSSETRTAPELDLDPTALTVVTPAIGEQLLNIAREALSNSVRHAGATHRSVSLTKTGSSIRLRIADDGNGFDPGRTRHRGHGLANMAARARTIGGQFTLDSAPGRGTSITIDVPTGDPHAC
jgi:PAS domain S-box-containing protein